MTTHRTSPRRLAALSLAAVVLSAVTVHAQPAGAPVTKDAPATQPTAFLALVVGDVENLSQKYVALAQAMAGKYDWRPGAGVRSVGEVFNLIVTENGMLVDVL